MKVCDAADWFVPGFSSIISSELHEVPRFHRKQWEFAIIFDRLQKAGVLHEDASGLALGAGRERLLYSLANHVQRIWATDLYSKTAVWPNARTDDLDEFLRANPPFQSRLDRLSAKSMDMREIEFPDESFDFAYSSSSVEHIGGWEDFKTHLAEVRRVLNPGGVHVLTTEFVFGPQLNTPNDFKFDAEGLEWWLRASGMAYHPVIDCRVAEHLFNTPLPGDLTAYFIPDRDNGRPDLLGGLVHVQLLVGRHPYTSVVLEMRKAPTDTPRVNFLGLPDTTAFLKRTQIAWERFIEATSLSPNPAADIATEERERRWATTYMWLGSKPRTVLVLIQTGGPGHITIGINKMHNDQPGVAVTDLPVRAEKTTGHIEFEFTLHCDADWNYQIYGETLEGLKLTNVHLRIRPDGESASGVVRRVLTISDDDTTSSAERTEFPAATFPFADGARLTENGYILADANVADGNVIFGPYVRLRPGRYRVQSRVEVLDCAPGRSTLQLDVNVDVHRVVAAQRMGLTQTGPIVCSLDFTLEHETLVEFRVGKEGPVEFRFLGSTLWTFDQFKVLGEEIGTSGRDFPLHMFSITNLAMRESGRQEGGIIVCPVRSGDGNVIYGPYQSIRAGRYRVTHRLDIEAVPEGMSAIEIDVRSAPGAILATKRISAREVGPLTCVLDFVLTQEDVVEFRVSKRGRIGFIHTGVSVRALHDEEPIEAPAGEEAFDPENLDFGPAKTLAIPASAFSIVGRTARSTPEAIVSIPQAADGNIIYGPYVRVPAGRYGMRPRITIQEQPAVKARLILDVYATDKGAVLTNKRIEITDKGLLDCRLDFVLEGESRLEFRVYKEGPISFRHSGVMLRVQEEDGAFDPVLDDTPFDPDKLGFDMARTASIPSSAFSIVAHTARHSGSEIVSEPKAADGDVIYGPYVRVPAGRYRMQPHIDIKESLSDGASVLLDVFAAGKGTSLAAKRIRITDEGPIGCHLDFLLEHEARLEFRVAKEGRIRFSHAGATLRIMAADEPLESASGHPPFNPEKLGFDDTGAVEIPSSAFSIVMRKARDTGSAILSNPRAADGHVIYGPYARVPAGRYRIRPHIDVEQCPTGGHLLLDVNATDKSVVVAARRIKITDQGPLGCDLEFALESDAQLEFRVSKEGPVAFKHAGVTLQALGADEPFADP
jgi:hypothetical protein